MSNISVIDLARMNKPKLNKTYSILIHEKMTLDKFFSDFLEENKLDHDNLDTPQWKTYKTKLTEYSKVKELIKWSEYYMNRNVFGEYNETSA